MVSVAQAAPEDLEAPAVLVAQGLMVGLVAATRTVCLVSAVADAVDRVDPVVDAAAMVAVAVDAAVVVEIAAAVVPVDARAIVRRRPTAEASLATGSIAGAVSSGASVPTIRLGIPR